jgi:glycosyltransferase involved in cell wall biosynthesis
MVKLGRVKSVSIDIDVILPTHQNTNYLTDSVNSILMSEGVKVRLIIVDDRADQSLKLDIPDSQKILLVSTGGNTGYNNAIQVGLNEAKSNFIAFQDSDDISDPRRLRREVDSLILEDAEIAYCKMQIIDNSGKKLFHYLQNVVEPSYFGYSLLFGSYGANSTWVIRRDAFEKINFSRFEKSYDWAIGLKSLVDLRIVYVHDSLYFYRKHRNQMTQEIEYQDKSLTEIYPLWSEQNRRMGLPHLELADFEALVNPWKKSNLTKKCIEWLVHLRNRIAHTREKELVFYRIMYLRIFMKCGFLSKFKLLFKFPSFILFASLHMFMSIIRFTVKRELSRFSAN